MHTGWLNQSFSTERFDYTSDLISDIILWGNQHFFKSQFDRIDFVLCLGIKAGVWSQWLVTDNAEHQTPSVLCYTRAGRVG